ncbi:MAG: hypothetical protein CM15mP66_08240 [Pseudomonadota bacterium]|nr:MAG: hypothetical protein CM15mP66_08240 [Pseudomonadota bacterium]
MERSSPAVVRRKETWAVFRGVRRFSRQLQDEGELVYFDLGNNFPKPSEQGNLKVSLIHQSLKEMNPSVILLGPNEWSYGKEFIDPGMPYLLSNGSGKLPYLKILRPKSEQDRPGFGLPFPFTGLSESQRSSFGLSCGPGTAGTMEGATDEEAWKLLLFRGLRRIWESFFSVPNGST